MTAFSRWTVLAAFALAACGGSGSSAGPDIRGFFPTEAELTALGWAEDSTAGGLVVLGRDNAQTHGIDGAADPFQAQGLIQVATNSYLKGVDERIEFLRVWQLPNADAAQAVYVILPDNDHYSGNWVDLSSIGDVACINERTTYTQLLVRKGAYIVDAYIQPPTEQTRADLIQLLQIVIGKLP